jgi:hypothetical protein
MDKEQKFCANCRWVDKDENLDSSYWICAAPANKAVDIDLVSGKQGPVYRFCDSNRRYGECGKEGKWYEAQPAV